MAQGMWPAKPDGTKSEAGDSVQVDRVGPLLSQNGILHHLGFAGVINFSLLPKNLPPPCRRVGMAKSSMIRYSEFEWPSFIPSIRGIQSSNWWSQLAKPRRSAISSKREEDCTTSVTKLTTWSQDYGRHAV